MRIALITPDFPPGGYSGIGSATLHLALGLKRIGQEVHVYTWLDDDSQSLPQLNGITVHRLPNSSTVTWWLDQLNRFLSHTRHIIKGGASGGYGGVLRDLRGAFTLRRLAKTTELDSFDIIEAPEWGGGVSIFNSSRIKGIKIAKFHGSLYSHAQRYKPYRELSTTDVRIASWIEREGTKHANVLLSPSKAMAEDACRWLGIKAQIRIIPNCVDLEYVHSFGRMEKPCKKRPGIYVLFVGRIDPLKGAHILNAVVGALRHRGDSGLWHFGLAGTCADIRLYPELSKVNQQNVEIEWLGFLPTERLFNELRQADIFLFPSHTENCPMALLEAMAFKLPIVASEVGGIPEMLNTGQEGILCPRDDVSAFVQALLALQEPAQREKLGQHAYARVARYDSIKIAQTWVNACH